MIQGIQSNSGIEAFYTDLTKAKDLLAVLDKEDAHNKLKELKELLIDYILANMRGNKEEIGELQSKMGALIQSYGDDMKDSKSIEEKLSSMDGDPTKKELSYIQGLINGLTHDLKSGDLSNLKDFT